VKRVGDLQQRFKIGEDIVDELLVTLKSWLINHIRSDDNDYVAIVKSSMENINTSSGDGWLKKSVKKFFG
jgi:hemerythrin